MNTYYTRVVGVVLMSMSVGGLCSDAQTAGVPTTEQAAASGSVYVSTDPTVNRLLEFAREKMKDTTWYTNGAVTLTRRNRLDKAISIAASNSRRDSALTESMQQEVGNQVSMFAQEIAGCAQFSQLLIENFKSVVTSFQDRIKRINDASKKK